MAKNRSIELQLIKPVSGRSNMKGRITLKELQKELLTDLNVPFADLCCDDIEDQIPFGAPVRFEDGELQYLDVATNTWTLIDTGGAALRFGVSGEDDTAAENRFFNNEGFNLEFGSSDAYLGFYLNSSFEIYAEVSNPNFVATGYAMFDMNASTGDGLCYIDLYVEGTNAATDAIEVLFEPNLLGIYLGTATNIEIVNVAQDDTSLQLLALDASGFVRYVDKSTIGAAALQAVTDIGNTTDNQIISSVLDTHAFLVEREGVQFGVGFAIEAGGTGWGGTYLGGSMEFTPSINSDKANVYIGLNPGQGRVPGGEFGMFLGYQAGLGHPGTDYKFYLGMGSNNHLLYGDFNAGDLWLKHAIRVGDVYDGTPYVPSAPAARVDIVAGSTTLAPIKLTAGTNLTVPVNGTLEFDGSALYFTHGGTRRTITMTP